MPALATYSKRYVIPLRVRYAIGFFLLTLCAFGYFVQIEPAWARWIIVITSMIAVVFAYSKMGGVDETDRDDDRRRLISLRFERKQIEKRRAQIEKIRALDADRQHVPELALQRTHPWQIRPNPYRDPKLKALVQAEMDTLINRISSHSRPQGKEGSLRPVFEDLLAFTESVARTYHPDAKQPLLEITLERLLKAVNRASLQVILLMGTLPMIRPFALNTMKLGTLLRWIRGASGVYKLWSRVARWLGSFFWYLWHGIKFVMLSWNPFAVIGYIVGAETTTSLISRFGGRAVSDYYHSLMQETLAIAAWETSAIYDPKHRFRNPDWIYGTELVHLHSLVDESPEILQETMRDLSSLSMRSSYDRIFLYRCLASNRSPDLASAEDTSVIPEETRIEIRDELEIFYRRHFTESLLLGESELREWREAVHQRLGLVFSAEQGETDLTVLPVATDSQPSLRRRLRRVVRRKIQNLPSLPKFLRRK